MIEFKGSHFEREVASTGMWPTVSEVEATAIRAAFEREGEFSAAIELRRLFHGVADNDQARDRAWTTADNDWSSG